MSHEYETKAWINGSLVDVVAVYEVDGMEPLVYGVFDMEDLEQDVTELIHPDEFNRIYSAICTAIVEDMTEAAEMACDLER